jgi:hypothetical protein
MPELKDHSKQFTVMGDIFYKNYRKIHDFRFTLHCFERYTGKNDTVHATNM